MKFIVVTGGVISSIGKGITSSSIGLLLQAHGLRVTAVKIDPYLNVDAGTMSPFEHGECYVLADGGEADLDMGNYERFLGIELTSDHNITTGKVYQSVLAKERAGSYLGHTVQVIPHITDEILIRIHRCAPEKDFDVCIIELGGVVGDLEGLPFVESLRQLSMQEEHQCCFVHVSMVIDNHGEPKTKPAQQGVRTMRKLGLSPDLLVMRSHDLLDDKTKAKLHNMCQVKPSQIFSNTDVPNIYYVPQLFLDQGMPNMLAQKLELALTTKPELSAYHRVLRFFKMPCARPLQIAIIGKYVGIADTYLSLTRAIEHASFETQTPTQVTFIDSETITKDESETVVDSILKAYDACIIPGGFGSRGIAGKIEVCRYCRVNDKPLLGICLGLQIMVTESWQALGHQGGSREWTDQGDAVIDMLPGQNGKLGGTMRLGSSCTYLKPESKTRALYKADEVWERHRHRYEVNNVYMPEWDAKLLDITGFSSTGLVEVVEGTSQKFYIGVQYHPEYKTRYDAAHPLFVGLLRAAVQARDTV